jgi:hypothetical protein
MRFIEGLATVRFDDERSAVETNFFGAGNVMTYKEAVQSAMEMATANQAKKLIFIKINFNDLDSFKFLSCIKEWLITAFNELDTGEILILTKIQAARKMSMLLKYNNLYNKDNRFDEKLKISVAVIDDSLSVLLHRTA